VAGAGSVGRPLPGVELRVVEPAGRPGADRGPVAEAVAAAEEADRHRAVAEMRAVASRAASEVRAAAEQMYVLPRALGRVYAGEEWQKVWEEDVRPIGSTFADFRGAARLWPSAADVHRYLTQDAVSRLNESFERQAREEASHAVLKRMLERRAMAAGVTFDVAADEYMRELVRALPIESLDSRFALPAGQEVFR